MSIYVNIRAATDAAIYPAVSVRLAHDTVPAGWCQTGLAWRACRLLEETRGGVSDGVLHGHNLFRTAYESYVCAARSRTEVPQDARLVWAVLVGLFPPRYSQFTNPGGAK